MADNYLEKKMEDYHNWRRVVSTTAGRRRGVLNTKFPSGRTLVLGADCEAGRALVRLYMDACWNAVFTVSNPAEGTRVAQECGGRFYPLSLDEIAADLQKKNEAIDVIVAIGEFPENLPIEVSRKILITSSDGVEAADDMAVIQGNDPEQSALLALVLSHPKSTVRGQIIRL